MKVRKCNGFFFRFLPRMMESLPYFFPKPLGLQELQSTIQLLVKDLEAASLKTSLQTSSLHAPRFITPTPPPTPMQTIPPLAPNPTPTPTPPTPLAQNPTPPTPTPAPPPPKTPTPSAPTKESNNPFPTPLVIPALDLPKTPRTPVEEEDDDLGAISICDDETVVHCVSESTAGIHNEVYATPLHPTMQKEVQYMHESAECDSVANMLQDTPAYEPPCGMQRQENDADSEDESQSSDDSSDYDYESCCATPAYCKDADYSDSEQENTEDEKTTVSISSIVPSSPKEPLEVQSDDECIVPKKKTKLRVHKIVPIKKKRKPMGDASSSDSEEEQKFKKPRLNRVQKKKVKRIEEQFNFCKAFGLERFVNNWGFVYKQKAVLKLRTINIFEEKSRYLNYVKNNEIYGNDACDLVSIAFFSFTLFFWNIFY